MSKQQGKYELLKEENNLRRKHTYIQGCLLVVLCGMSSVTVYTIWTMIYRQNLIIPPTLIAVSPHWHKRIVQYEGALRESLHREEVAQFDAALAKELEREPYGKSTPAGAASTPVDGKPQPEQHRMKELDNERIFPSRFGNYIYSKEATRGEPPSPKIVCYYTTPSLRSTQRSGLLGGRGGALRHTLLPERIDPHLCTHLNIGIIAIVNGTLFIDDDVRESLARTRELRRANPDLRILLWVGGGSVGGFSEMVVDHASRKVFIQSLKAALEQYRLDGVDLDWEFPDSCCKRRMHFSQLLHEIRREYQREHRTYILSVAVAPQETIAYMAYDVGEINNYADYVNLMTYDYHFYSSALPQTGLNAPLYRRANEHSLLGTLNINASVEYWLSAGLDKSKLIIGLPTYGHTYTLVNPFNARIGAPASSVGRVGTLGFASYSEVCWFRRHNIYVHQVYDVDSCSPYLYAGSEWISYDDERSLECKANYIKAHGFGGAMIFSLNTDDFGSYCADNALYSEEPAVHEASFPLLRKVRSILVPPSAPGPTSPAAEETGIR
ncbi:AGAP000436-PA-like protein [Anopheles sinensis]|uniref:AGAP000436-PA-like protein n=1 Tax=Anopheles sinensis TaxID=74873 RepID=A0A084VLE5_ANOSI|nr:AGAP000436-PA-like protein [Anopheles sinensis]